ARGRSIRRVRRVVDGVIKYFAQSCCNRNELGCEPGWQRIGRALQTLGYELTCTVNVALVGELKCDLRQTEARQRTHFGYTSHPTERHFQRHGDEFFHFIWRERRHCRIHLDLHSSDVGNRVHRKFGCRPNPAEKKRESAHQNENSLANGELQNFVDHRGASSPYSLNPVKISNSCAACSASFCNSVRVPTRSRYCFCVST